MEKRVDIYYHGPGNNIQVCGSWDGWKKKINLDKVNEGYFTVYLNLRPGVYQYKFVVDGEWKILDNCTNVIQSDIGNFNHVLVVGGGNIHVSFEWNKGSNQVFIYLQPDWEKPYKLVKKESLHYLELELPIGTYQYKYLVDNEWRYREDLPYVKNRDGSVNNIIQVVPGKQISFLFFNEYLMDIPIPHIKYFVYTPLDYIQSVVVPTSKDWPIILYLHGSDQCSTNIELLKKSGLTKHLEEKPVPFIVLSPHCTEDYLYLNYPDILIDLLYQVLEKYKIDRQRIYVVGIENGARAALKLGRRFPYLITAVAVLSGNYQISDIEACEENDMPPLAIYHSKHDQKAPVGECVSVIEKLKKGLEENKSSNVKINVYETIKSDAWHDTILRVEIFDWLMKHTSKRGV
jgi:hypothetical protein